MAWDRSSSRKSRYMVIARALDNNNDDDSDNNKKKNNNNNKNNNDDHGVADMMATMTKATTTATATTRKAATMTMAAPLKCHVKLQSSGASLRWWRYMSKTTEQQQLCGNSELACGNVRQFRASLRQCAAIQS